MRSMISRRVAGVLAAVVTVAGLSACGTSAQNSSSASAGGAAPKDTIVIAMVPSEQSQSLKDQYANLITLIEKETGKKVVYQDATDYSAVIEGQRAGKIDLAGYGPFSYKIAKDSGVPIVPLGAGVKKKDAKPGYTSMLWTKPESGIKGLKDLKGKNVCFVDPASTSGTLVPTGGLMKEGLDPTKDMKQIFAGAHDASVISTANGQCDAGFAFDDMVPSLIKKGQLKEGQLVKVWESDLIPGSPIAMNTQTLDKATQDKLIAMFKDNKANVDYMVKDGICKDAASCKMAGDSGWGYIAVDDKSFDPIRELCKQTNAKACKA